MSFTFNFADAQFSAPELNAPRPCTHASNCYYNGPNGCAFVHPGEEGTGMKIFPARSVKDEQTGQEKWQKATVRLIGGASFYERRRMKMSWPAWCALPKNAHLPKPAFKAVPSPVVPPPETAGTSLTQGQQMFQILAEAVAYQAKAEAIKRQQMGNALYAIIAPFLTENEKEMNECGIWNTKFTAGKLTGMLLENFSYEELYPMLSNMELLKENLAECCVVINEAATKAEA